LHAVFNPTLALVMSAGRFAICVPVLCIADVLAAKRVAPASAGTLPTHGAQLAKEPSLASCTTTAPFQERLAGKAICGYFSPDHDRLPPQIRLSRRGVARQAAVILELTNVSEVATKAASAVLTGQTGVQSVAGEPAVDSEGHGALNITIVLKRGTADKMSGNQALDTLVSLERALREAKDERFPIVYFAIAT
jgi:hypothetical protein